jgi:ligand-binding SRPBCC domain-containing protein
MAVFQFQREQTFNCGPEKIWDFISSPKNLSFITPARLDFNIISPSLPEKIYPGLIIQYHVRPLFGIKTNWVTRISQVKNLKFFVDEQLKGPYKIWHHEHHLETLQNGHTKMIDIVTYEPPFRFLGSLANRLMLQNELKKIFDYRTEVLNELFN